jgi:glycosyltransferase involved in cell wall biosynthesis
MKFFLFLLFIFPLVAEEKQKICLNMIVKDESKVIRRCLDSVKSAIDYWVIVDTGSTDGTQEIIKEHLKDIPGELHESPWKNFGENRTEAIELAKGKGDYILFMDADDVLEFENEPQFPKLEHDLYNFWRGTAGFTYLKPQLVKDGLPWKWVGVTHEYLDCSESHSSEILQGVKYVSRDGGFRSSNPKKFRQNIKLLKGALKEDPTNSRHVFYLAESYRDAGEKGKALEWFQKRIDMRGWEEEVFWSKLQLGHLLRWMGLPSTLVTDCYMRAFNYRNHRLEPLYYLAELYNQQGQYDQAYACIKMKDSISFPFQKDALFNEDWIEEYGLLCQLSICSFYLGKYQESLDACDALLAMPNLPEHWRSQIEVNRAFPLEKLQTCKNECTE